MNEAKYFKPGEYEKWMKKQKSMAMKDPLLRSIIQQVDNEEKAELRKKKKASVKKVAKKRVVKRVKKEGEDMLEAIADKMNTAESRRDMALAEARQIYESKYKGKYDYLGSH